MDDNLSVRREIQLFKKLCEDARACRICPNLADKTAVLSDLNGSPHSEDHVHRRSSRTRREQTELAVPFFGDKSGNNFQTLLDSINLSRDDIFITSAVMCSPRSATDANRRPTRTEIKNCSTYLIRVLELIRPKVIATLGGVALEALTSIAYHEFRLKTHAGAVLSWEWTYSSSALSSKSASCRRPARFGSSAKTFSDSGKVDLMNSTDRLHYNHVRTGGTAYYRQPRGLISVRGTEAVQFLDGMITNDVKTLVDGGLMKAALPNAQGRLLAVVRVTRNGERLLIETEGATRQKVFDHLFRFTMAGDFQVEDLSEEYSYIRVFRSLLYSDHSAVHRVRPKRWHRIFRP
jgi:DNA polymerase